MQRRSYRQQPIPTNKKKQQEEPQGKKLPFSFLPFAALRFRPKEIRYASKRRKAKARRPLRSDCPTDSD